MAFKARLQANAQETADKARAARMTFVVVHMGLFSWFLVIRTIALGVATIVPTVDNVPPMTAFKPIASNWRF